MAFRLKRPFRSAALALATLFCGATQTVAQTAASVRVPDEPSCSSCVIAIRTLATLGSADGPGSLTGPPNAVRMDARGRYWVLVESAPPMVFDRLGAFVRVVGGRGSGPGEFGAPIDAVPIPGDSMLVVDRAEPRATVIGPDLRPARQIRLPWDLGSAVPLQWPTLVVMNGIVPTADAAGWPIHRVSFQQSGAVLLGSFGPDQGELRPGREPELLQRLSPARGGRFWAADLLRCRVTLWTAAGTRVRTLERTPDWFATTSAMGIGNPTTPPPPRITAIQEDSLGLLWVFVSTPAENWREAWRRVSSAARDVSARSIAFEDLFWTTIEVIDPHAARVVARRTVNQWVIAALPQRRAAVYSVDAAGIPHIAIVELTL